MTTRQTDRSVPLAGAVVRDISRRAIGHVVSVLVAPIKLDARWIVIHLDTDDRDVAVPVPTATEAVHGELLVPYSARTIEHAPPTPTGAVMDTSSAERLRRHYGFPA